jgi:uncharacterized protein
MGVEGEVFAAIQVGDLEKLNALLGRDPGLAQARSPAGVSALLWAQYHQRPAIIEALLARHGPTDLFEASALGQLDGVKEFVKANAKQVNTFTPDGFSPLGLACFFGRSQVVAFLLEHGADPNAEARNASRVRPIHSAAAHSQAGPALEMVRLLLEKGADPNLGQAGEWTPLHQAAAHGSNDLVRLLLEHGANPDAAAEDGQTPIQLALKSGHLQTAQLLRSLGAAGD